MKALFTLILSAACAISASAQIDTITNAGFERWGNASPGNASEPSGWYSDQSGSEVASLGPQTCFKDSTAPYAGSYCVKVETESYLGIEVVNGVVTTGVVNAPTTNKANGYIGTINYTDASDIRRMPFTGKPDSLVGWYQYSAGATTERGKIRAILHIGNYFDPETPTTYHPNPIDSQIASALFLTDTPATTVSAWTRFSVPFTYINTGAPAYIMINVTPSDNQNTSVSGSTMLLDGLGVIYNTTAVKPVNSAAFSIASFPNPVKDELTVNITGGAGNGRVALLDISGKVITVVAASGNTATINVSGLAAGIYFMRYTDAGHTQTIKVNKL